MNSRSGGLTTEIGHWVLNTDFEARTVTPSTHLLHSCCSHGVDTMWEKKIENITPRFWDPAQIVKFYLYKSERSAKRECRPNQKDCLIFRWLCELLLPPVLWAPGMMNLRLCGSIDDFWAVSQFQTRGFDLMTILGELSGFRSFSENTVDFKWRCDRQTCLLVFIRPRTPPKDFCGCSLERFWFQIFRVLPAKYIFPTTVRTFNDQRMRDTIKFRFDTLSVL